MLKRLDQKFWGTHSLISVFMIVSIILFYPDIDTDENGLVEWLQSAFIALSFFTFLLGIYLNQGIKERLISSGFSLLSLSFLLRELDVEKFDLPIFLITLGSGSGRNIFLGLLWIILFGLIYKYREHFTKEAVAKFLFSGTGQLLMFAALMLILGAMMDKNVLKLDHLTTRFYEELLELLGYIYYFGASVNWIFRKE